MKPMSAKELAAALQELLRGVQRQIDREGDLELVEGEGEIRGDSGDTNLWIKDGDSYISFSFEGSEIDGELQGVLVPEKPLAWMESAQVHAGRLREVLRYFRPPEPDPEGDLFAGIREAADFLAGGEGEAVAGAAALSDSGLDDFLFGTLRQIVRETGGDIARRLAWFMAGLDRQMVASGFPPMGSLPERVEMSPELRALIRAEVAKCLADHVLAGEVVRRAGE